MRLGVAERRCFLVRDVNRVDAGEPRIQNAVLAKQLDRTLTILAHARFHLGGLFSHVHMYGQVIGSRVAQPPREDNPAALRARYAEQHPPKLGQTRDLGNDAAHAFRIRDEILNVRSQKSRLPGIWRLVPSRAHIRSPQ